MAALATTLLLPCALAVVAAMATTSVEAQDTAAGAQAFLDLQNAARADVGVAPLAWDDTVAAYAGSYAEARKGDCKLQRSNGPYGENIFWGSSGASWTAADAVTLWVGEKQYYNCSDGSCAAPAGMVCRHYMQVVWANTSRVGCAAVTCDRGGGTFMVCEYDPPGNIPGVWPYAGCEQFNRSAQNSPQDFLDLQNVARASVGVGMLSWDSTVAAYSESYAEKRKNDCQKNNSGGPYGENIFLGAGGISWTASDAIFSWLREKQYYDCPSNTCSNRGTCGDYTQLVWANSTRVGCASVTCENNDGGTFITCNYDPPGNVPGGRPYLGCVQAGRTTSPVPDNGNGSSPKENGNDPSGNRSSPSNNKNNPPILPIILPLVTILGLISAISLCIWRRSRLKRKLCTTSSEDIEDLKSVLLEPSVIRAATDNFAERNKLGEGGFGKVYKGLMPDGQEIAVKRLSRGSKQGLREFKNELLLVAKLQHRNLVKLVGACLDGEDKLLVYEYIPNKSLDAFLYDDQKRDELAWDIGTRSFAVLLKAWCICTMSPV